MFFRPDKFIAIILFAFATSFCFAAEVVQQTAADVPFLYPDPKTVGVHPYIMSGKPAGAVTPNRYAGVSEQERQARIQYDLCQQEIEGFAPSKEQKCPLCEDDPKTPCGKCKMCLAGFPCEKTLCRHCVQPRSKNMGNSCDLAAGDEPCGTCDACREHRSDPCEHADNEYDQLGQFNPYHEPRFLSAIPRPILDTYNNGARKFPVYYNPAPYYRPTWNPSLLAGYARPFTFRWSCPLCYKNPCECDQPGLAGQVPFAYTCKFCGRNPCACAQNICDVTKPMDPKGIAKALAEMKGEATVSQPQEIQETSGSSDSSSESGGRRVDQLFDDASPMDTEPEKDEPTPPARPQLDAPVPEVPQTDGSRTMS